ncbi:MAG: glycosyltransferase [Saprospiraceae bacterium]
MKKFLLITYYWPPSGGAGVMRWAKMSKYISEFGWQPIIYTPSGNEVAVHDESLLKEIPSNLEVIKTPIWEPYDLYKSFLGRKKKDKLYSGFINENKKESIAQKISVFIRGNFFIPDARMFWIKPSIKFLKTYLHDHPVDAIISTGPPHSMHMIADALHRSTHIPWIADFRDPWTNIDFYRDLRLTKWGDARHRRLEKRILRNATKVVAVTWRMGDEFKALSSRDDIQVILNGFDDADYVKPASITLDPEFTMVHVGSMNKDRNPDVLWKSIQLAIASSSALKEKIKVKLIGPVDFSVRASIEKFDLKDFTSFIEFVPHSEAVKIQQQAQVLLLLINDAPSSLSIIPGKLYEYLGAGRPILSIGPPDSDSAKVINMAKGGVVHGYHDVEGIKNRILEYFSLYQNGNLSGTSEGVEKFTRKERAKDFAQLLESLTEKKKSPLQGI